MEWNVVECIGMGRQDANQKIDNIKLMFSLGIYIMWRERNVTLAAPGAKKNI